MSLDDIVSVSKLLEKHNFVLEGLARIRPSGML